MPSISGTNNCLLNSTIPNNHDGLNDGTCAAARTDMLNRFQEPGLGRGI
jgi:hypothetical protein